MEIGYDILGESVIYASGFFLVYYFCYRRYIYSVFDPLFIYVFGLSFSSVLVVFTLSDRPAYFIHFFLCHACLFLGFSLLNYLLKRRRIDPGSNLFPLNFNDYKILRTLVYFLFGFYCLVNLILLYTSGFALLSDDPTIAKVENFAQGFGIILKINWGIGGFIVAGLLFLILSELRTFDLWLLLIVTVLTALEGSKSSLLRILITYALIANHPVFYYKRQVIDKIRMLLPVGFIALFSVFFIVLVKESTDSEQAFFAFVRRLLYGADSTLYFYAPVNEQYFSRFRFWEYPSHLFNQIFGFLRLVPYQEALGNVMVQNVLPNNTGTIVGPNTPYYIEGQIYFGYYGGFAYSFMVGSMYALIRLYFFKSNYYSAFWLVLICCICQQASALTVEVTLFLTQAFDTCFFVIPAYVFVSLAVRGKIRIRSFHF